MKDQPVEAKIESAPAEVKLTNLEIVKHHIAKYSWTMGSLLAFLDGCRLACFITKDEASKILVWAQTRVTK